MAQGLRLVAIDPGDVHVGTATFIGAECVWVQEMRPAEVLSWVEQLLMSKAIDVLVIESFRLYPDKARQLAHSELPTVQLIGALKYVHARWGADVELCMQRPDIKKPIAGMLRAKKIRSQAKAQKVAGQHVIDAELHGYWFLAQRGML